MQNFVDRRDLYLYKRPDKEEETRKRLTEIQELGMTECGVAQFGIEGVMSGLYIEIVWSYSDKDFNEYMDWVKEMINKKR